jgi:hypothetical protein
MKDLVFSSDAFLKALEQEVIQSSDRFRG